MIVVADASVLVAELLRRRGRALFQHADLRVVVAEDQWNEAQHELQRRLEVLVNQDRLTAEQASVLYGAVLQLIDDNALEVIPHAAYESQEQLARSRVPRDQDDWPTVALAMTLKTGILTSDKDFLGCGCPTWTFQTLQQELDVKGSPGTQR